jgi:hypothetical protein
MLVLRDVETFDLVASPSQLNVVYTSGTRQDIVRRQRGVNDVPQLLPRRLILNHYPSSCGMLKECSVHLYIVCYVRKHIALGRHMWFMC